jgi:WD40 repeat protein
MQDGQSIISGWSDGKIRAFGPQSGKLLYTIHDAHQGAVTAISGTPDSTRIISGGEEGMVRMWAIHHNSQVMEASMKVLLLKLLTAKARTAQEGQLSKGYKASMHVKGARAAFSLCNGTPCRHTRHVPGNGMKSQVQFIQMRQCF